MAEPNPILLRVGDKHAFEFQRGQNDLALFASIGGAIAVIQSFELSVGTMVELLARKSKPDQPISNEDSERLYSQTLGILIRLFKRNLPDAELDKSLEAVREKRNYLVHHILRKYQWPIMSDDEYVKAIREIEGIRELIENTNIEIAMYISNRSLLNLLAVSINHQSGEITQVV